MTSEHSSPQSGWSRLLDRADSSDALLIAAVPVFGYAAAFAFKTGTATRFKIPLELITLDLQDILLAIGISSSAFIVLAMVLNVFHSMVMRDLEKPPTSAGEVFRTLLEPNIPILVAPIPFMILYRTPGEAILMVEGAFIALFILPTLLVALVRGEGSYLDRIRRMQRAETAARTPMDRVPRRLVRGVLLAIYIVVLFFAVGDTQALYRETFLVTSQGPPRAVLAIYRDRMVLAPVDLRSRHIGRGRDIVSLGTTEQLFTLRHIGPLDADPPHRAH